jgi:hypothetical protein
MPSIFPSILGVQVPDFISDIAWSINLNQTKGRGMGFRPPDPCNIAKSFLDRNDLRSKLFSAQFEAQKKAVHREGEKNPEIHVDLCIDIYRRA